jgi:hypothetical protein
MKSYNSNYKFCNNRYKFGYKNLKYHFNHRTNKNKYQTHQEHPVRDTIYATLTCLFTVCFVSLWWGIDTGDYIPLIVGISSSAFAFVTVIASFLKSFKKYKNK